MVCGSCRTFLIAPFLRRIYAVTDTVIAVARPETIVETITAAQPGSALLSFRTHFVGNGFIRSVATVLPAIHGRADATSASTQCKCATEKTDSSVPYSYRFEFRQNRYILKQCSAYGVDIITPHLPQAASSPQAPQGEDNWGAQQNSASHQRMARQPRFPPLFRTGLPEINVLVGASMRL